MARPYGGRHVRVQGRGESANGVILWNADVRPVKGLKAPRAVV